MRGSIFRKLAVAILSMDLSDAGRRQLEEFLKDKNRVQELLDACHKMQGILGADLGKARWTRIDRNLAGDWAAEKLFNAVAARPALTTRGLSEIVEWVCGRAVQPGRVSKREYVERLGKRLSRDEVDRVAQKVMEVPRSGETKAMDEWFEQMSRRAHAER